MKYTNYLSISALIVSLGTATYTLAAPDGMDGVKEKIEQGHKMLSNHETYIKVLESEMEDLKKENEELRQQVADLQAKLKSLDDSVAARFDEAKTYAEERVSEFQNEITNWWAGVDFNLGNKDGDKKE